MTPEGKELLLNFYRRWSTLEITDENKPHLMIDVQNVKTMLRIYGDDPELVGGAQHEDRRSWFAQRFNDLRGLRPDA